MEEKSNTSQRVFIDSNYFIALANPKDSLHSEAMRIAPFLEGGDIEIVLSDYIFLEVVTVISQRVGKRSALAMGRKLRSTPGITLIKIDAQTHNSAWKIFQEVIHKNISFVDCSIIALMRDEDIYKLLTFDMDDFNKLRRYYNFDFYGRDE